MSRPAHDTAFSVSDPEPEDGVLLKRIGEGDEVAFAVLVRRHAGRFHRIATRIVLDATEAEDLVQEAFLRLWQRPALFDAARGVRFTTWFHRIVINLGLDRLRRSRRISPGEPPDIADPARSPEDQALGRDAARMLARALAALPDRQRVAIELAYEGELGNQDAADAMGLRLKAYQSLLLRARTALRNHLQPLF